jgi:hypothetical protein
LFLMACSRFGSLLPLVFVFLFAWFVCLGRFVAGDQRFLGGRVALNWDHGWKDRS